MSQNSCLTYALITFFVIFYVFFGLSIFGFIYTQIILGKFGQYECYYTPVNDNQCEVVVKNNPLFNCTRNEVCPSNRGISCFVYKGQMCPYIGYDTISIYAMLELSTKFVVIMGGFVTFGLIVMSGHGLYEYFCTSKRKRTSYAEILND